jgi:hypothetical protein
VTAAHRAAVAGVIVAGVLAGCLPAAGSEMRLENATDVPVAIHVDGSWVGTYPPEANRTVPIPGTPPHRIELFTASGARLVDWGFDTAGAGGGATTTVDLPCGVIRLSVGPVDVPSLGPSTASPGPCH